MKVKCIIFTLLLYRTTNIKTIIKGRTFIFFRPCYQSLRKKEYQIKAVIRPITVQRFVRIVLQEPVSSQTEHEEVKVRDELQTVQDVLTIAIELVQDVSVVANTTIVTVKVIAEANDVRSSAQEVVVMQNGNEVVDDFGVSIKVQHRSRGRVVGLKLGYVSTVPLVSALVDHSARPVN